MTGRTNSSAAQPVLDTLSVTENGSYTPPSGTDGYSRVNVNVPAGGTLQTKDITANGTYYPDEGYDGIGQANVNVELHTASVAVNIVAAHMIAVMILGMAVEAVNITA